MAGSAVHLPWEQSAAHFFIPLRFHSKLPAVQAAHGVLLLL